MERATQSAVQAISCSESTTGGPNSLTDCDVLVTHAVGSSLPAMMGLRPKYFPNFAVTSRTAKIS